MEGANGRCRSIGSRNNSVPDRLISLCYILIVVSKTSLQLRLRSASEGQSATLLEEAKLRHPAEARRHRENMEQALTCRISQTIWRLSRVGTNAQGRQPHMPHIQMPTRRFFC